MRSHTMDRFNMERSIEILIALSLLTMGASHILQPRAWAEFFIDLRERGNVGVLWTAFLHFPVGVIVVAFHPVWSGIPLLVTLLGCGWTLKGVIYFCFPSIGQRQLARVSLDRAGMFAIPGVMMVLLSAVVIYGLWQG